MLKTVGTDNFLAKNAPKSNIEARPYNPKTGRQWQADPKFSTILNDKVNLRTAKATENLPHKQKYLQHFT